MAEVVDIGGFVRLVRALSSEIDSASTSAIGEQLAELAFTLDGDVFALDVPDMRCDWVIESPEPSCTIVASPGGAVTHFWRAFTMERIPLYLNGEAMRLTILGMPFLVWHITSSAESRQAARMCGFVAPTQVWTVDVTAPDAQELMLMFGVLRSIRRAG
jgi:hypothetical protein